MEIEEKGRQMIEKGDQTAFIGLMREKAEIILALSEQARVFYPYLPESVCRQAEKELGRFSKSAANSLNLDSAFYMSALLYRDDHQPEEPDNLALCIERLGVLFI